MSDLPRVLIISESIARSWARDASTFAMFIGLIGVGWMLDSSAMQWVGAFIGGLTVLRGSNDLRKELTFTIPEARVELDRLEAKKS
jgi:hypothetical protein